MVFFILNIVACLALVAFSFSADAGHSKTVKNGNPLVNLILFHAVLFGLMALTLGTCRWAPPQLAGICGRVTFVFMGWYLVEFCSYMVAFPSGSRHPAFSTFQWAMNLLAAYMVLFMPGCVTGISADFTNRFMVESAPLLAGIFGDALGISTFQLYVFLYAGLMPLLSAVMVLVRAENTAPRLEQQRLCILALGVVFSWLTLLFFRMAFAYQPMIATLVLVGFLPLILFALYAENTDLIWDMRSVRRSAVRFSLTFLAPGVLEGGVFVLAHRLVQRYPFWANVLFVAFTVLVIVGWVLTGRRFVKLDVMRDRHYAELFESELAAIKFEDDPQAIVRQFSGIFSKYVDVKFLHLLVDANNGFMESLFVEDDKVAVSMDNESFDVLLNLKRQIVFRNDIRLDYALATVQQPLLELLDSVGAEALIMLNEGRHVVGIILLGGKRSGNPFNEYDLEVFKKLYSSFFVTGYFLKNIANEAVVGTVNREIRMSGQIITSIQENMDRMTSPKVDCGYRMIPAHNIGGEFVDMIRLNESRHLFIVGALSGKGIAASMSMVILKSIIRTYLAETDDFKKLVEKVNIFIRGSLPKGSFFAGTFGLMDFSTDTMYYINCGAPALFEYSRVYNNVIEIQGEGHILGFAKDMSKLIRVKKVKLAAGDIVVACTDGLIDSKSLRGEPYGKTRIQTQIMESSSYSADKMSQFMYEALVEFSSKALEDDITILVFKYNGGK